MGLTFYFTPGSSSMAPHIALHEAGASFEPRPISFERKEQQGPAFRAINPEGKVPVLVVDGQPLTEVAGILFYIARAYPAAGLLPESTLDQAQVVSWMSFIASTVHPARRQGVAFASEVWALTEKRFSGRKWVTGRYSIADIHLFRLFWRAANSFGFPRADFPSLYDLYDRMMEREAVKTTVRIEEAIGYHLPELKTRIAGSVKQDR